MIKKNDVEVNFKEVQEPSAEEKGVLKVLETLRTNAHILRELCATRSLVGKDGINIHALDGQLQLSTGGWGCNFDSWLDDLPGLAQELVSHGISIEQVTSLAEAGKSDFDSTKEK